jgi:hypothetical protein
MSLSLAGSYTKEKPSSDSLDLSKQTFPFDLLPQPIQFECVKFLGAHGCKIFRLVNSQFRKYVDKYVFIIFVPLTLVRLDGENLNSMGYSVRLKKILEHYKKSSCTNFNFLS